VAQQREGRNLRYRPAIAQMNSLMSYLTAHCCQGAGCEINLDANCNNC
jgi:ArsR family transcriptional regulator